MQIHTTLRNTVLMITHDVEEAVLLSDRIVMLTNGPSASIGSILDVPLPRPRARLELLADPTYTSCRAAVLEFLARDNPRARTADPNSVIDASIVKELDDSGFIKKLYQ